MNKYINQLIETARSQLNYLEKETWDNLDDFTANAGDENYVKYSRDLAAIKYFNGSKRGVAWCSVFVAWNFVQVFGKDMALALLCQPSVDNCGAGCNSAREYFKRMGQLHTTAPQPGDVIFFWNSTKKEASHTGIVEKVDNTYVYTIEGNTSSASGVIANGGAVAAKKYKLTHSRIAGYGRPDYSMVITNNPSEPKEETTMTTGTAWVKVENGSTVNYRQKPSTLAAKVKGMNTIRNGEEVTITSGDQTWAAVDYKGYSGYVMLKFLTQDEPQKTDNSTNKKSVEQIVSEITSLLSELAAMAK